MPVDLNTWVLFAIAAFNAIAAFLAWRTKAIVANTQIDVAATKVAAIETKVAAEKTEVNTNHMREELVARTGEAAHAAGREEMRVEGEVKAATLAEGKLQGQKE